MSGTKRTADERRRAEEDEFDAGAIQARLDLSMAMVDELVESWISPTSSSSLCSSSATQAQHIQAAATVAPLVARYPGLGLGAKPSSLSEKRLTEAKLLSKLLPNSKKGQRQLQQQQQSKLSQQATTNRDNNSDEEEEESRTKTISSASASASSKPRNSLLSMFDTAAVSKKKRKQQQQQQEQQQQQQQNGLKGKGKEVEENEPKKQQMKDHHHTSTLNDTPTISENGLPENSSHEHQSEDTIPLSSPSKKQQEPKHTPKSSPHLPVHNRHNIQHPNSPFTTSPSKRQRKKRKKRERSEQ